MSNIQNFRPTSFSDVIGNENQIKLMRNSLSDNKFPAFSILIGKAGIGKTTLAKLIAKAIRCEQPVNGNACDRCPTCMKVISELILSDNDVDNIITYRMSDEGGKIAARHILEQIKAKPVGGGKKVILLEECQGLRHDAQDLLLPILEYIPDHTHIIAMTTDESKLQNTFTSRAVVYRLNQPAPSQVEMLLHNASQRLGLTIKGNAVIPRLVEYGMRPRESLNLLLKVSQISKEISVKEVNEYLNLADDILYLRYLEALKSDMGAILDFLDTLKYEGVEVANFMRGLNTFMMRLLVFRYRNTHIQDSIITASKDFLRTTDEDDLMIIQGIIAEEVKKFGQEEYDDSQFVATAFKVQSRNKENLHQRALKSTADVAREKEQRRTQLSEQVANTIAKKTADEYATSQDVSTFISGLPNAKIVNVGKKD